MSETQTMADVSDERLAQTIADVDAPGINIPDWLREHLRRALTELQARRAADAGMREALKVAADAIQWMSAASDFAPGGKAHEGWKSIRRDLEKINAALGARND